MKGNGGVGMGQEGGGFVLALRDACTQAYKCQKTKAVIKGRCSDSLLITGKDFSDGLLSAPVFHLLIRFPGLLVHSKREGRGCLGDDGARIMLRRCLEKHERGRGFCCPKAFPGGRSWGSQKDYAQPCSIIFWHGKRTSVLSSLTKPGCAE